MAGQTTYYGKVNKLETNGRYILQCGSLKFMKKAKTVSIATDLKYIRYAGLKWRTGGAIKEGSGVILYTTGTVASRRVIVNRVTLGGTMSGKSLWYELIGF